jgi:hypothetical protein
MTLQLAHPVVRVNRKFDEKRPTGGFLLDVVKTDTEWVKGLPYKLS